MTYFYIFLTNPLYLNNKRNLIRENLMKVKETLLSGFDNVFLIKSLVSLEIMIHSNIPYRTVM